MRKTPWLICVILLASMILNAGSGVLDAVTFESKSTDGSQSSSTPNVTGDYSPKENKNAALLYALEAPTDQKQRLAESIEGMYLTGLQATMTIDTLKSLENKTLPDDEILARLEHTHESLEALERAAKRLDDNVKLVQLACKNDPILQQEVMAFLRQFLATPANAFTGDPYADSLIANEIQGIGRAAKSSFDSFMGTLSSAAKSVGNAARSVKNAVSNGIGKLTGAVGKVHTKIGSVVGQKNWATIMAGTKFVATTVGGTVALVAVVTTAPVTSIAVPLGAVVVWTASNVGASVSLANDLSTIQGGRGAPGLDNAMTRINQGTALIGVLSGGSSGEVFVNVMGVAGNEIVGTTPGQQMTPEELADFLDEPARQDFLNNTGGKTIYIPPHHHPEGGEGNGGGGGGSCGCGGHND